MNGAAGTRKKEKASYGRAKKNGEKKSKKGAEGFSSGREKGGHSKTHQKIEPSMQEPSRSNKRCFPVFANLFGRRDFEYLISCHCMIFVGLSLWDQMTGLQVSFELIFMAVFPCIWKPKIARNQPMNAFELASFLNLDFRCLHVNLVLDKGVWNLKLCFIFS